MLHSSFQGLASTGALRSGPRARAENGHPEAPVCEVGGGRSAIRASGRPGLPAGLPFSRGRCARDAAGMGQLRACASGAL